jgi:hypothetical protein
MERSPMNRFGVSPNKAAIAALLCCITALVSGCNNSRFLNGTDTTPVAGDALQGTVHGGQNPISGATVQLWAVGSSGYGSAASKLGSSVQTNSSGVFTLGTYSCPSSTAQTYITSQGGNPGLGTGTNANIMLATALGNCGNLGPTTTIMINEVTTEATAVALGQYFTPAIGGLSSADSFGAPSTTQAQTGIANAMATVNNLVTISTGAPVSSVILPVGCVTPGTAASPCVTATPESGKIYAIANILAACVNTAGGTAGDSSPCGQLFGDVVPTSGTAPTDTLQAAVYMSLNPTSNNANGSTTNLAALCNLQVANAPFPSFNCNTTSPTQQPTDWTIGIAYTDQTASTFFLQPQNIAADSSGNIWVLNDSGSATNGSLVEVSPTGVPLENTLTSATVGTGINVATPRNLAIDLNNNSWVTTTVGTGLVFEVSPAGATLGSFATGKGAFGVAIDANSDVFVGQESSSAHFELYEFPAANIGTPIVYPIATATPGTAGTNGTNAYVLPEYMAFDTAGNLWMTNGSASPATGPVNQVVELSNINISACSGYSGTYPCPSGSTSTGTPLPTSTTENTFTGLSPAPTSGAAIGTPYGIAANTNGMWFTNSSTGNDSVTDISLSGATSVSYGGSTVIGSPRFIAVDGAGNAWVGDKGGAGTAVAEFSKSGTVLSPTAGTAPFTAAGFVHAGLDACLGIATDPSGNVWVANNTATNGIFEIVGAAAPTVTPIAQQLVTPVHVGVRP